MKKSQHTESNRTRPVRLTLRMTQEEYDTLVRKAEDAGLSRQAYILRRIAGNGDGPEVQGSQTVIRLLNDLLVQLRGIGTNCNQMARIANTYGDIPAGRVLAELGNSYNGLAQEVRKIWQYLKQ